MLLGPRRPGPPEHAPVRLIGRTAGSSLSWPYDFGATDSPHCCRRTSSADERMVINGRKVTSVISRAGADERPIAEEPGKANRAASSVSHASFSLGGEAFEAEMASPHVSSQ